MGLIARQPQAVAAFLAEQRWFSGKARGLRSVQALDVIPLDAAPRAVQLALVHVTYTDGTAETYSLPLILPTGEPSPGPQPNDKPQTPCLKFRSARGQAHLLYFDAVRAPAFLSFLFQTISAESSFAGLQGKLRASHSASFGNLYNARPGSLKPSLMTAEQSNSSARYGQRFILKLYRRLEQGRNPDIEVGVFLTETARFAHTPPVAGALEYVRAPGPPMSLAILHGYVKNRGDAWQYTLDSLAPFLERALGKGDPPPARAAPASLGALAAARAARRTIGRYWDSARLLGRRTAELHLALASRPRDPDFSPEPFTPAYQRRICDSMQELAARNFQLLRRRLPRLPKAARAQAQRISSLEPEIQKRFEPFIERRITARRIRIHGDYHLGQVLYTGSDFAIIDFEGEPARPLEERRIKRSPLRDVAGMLRSFHYAAYTSAAQLAAGRRMRKAESTLLDAWAQFWQESVSSAFLQSYLRTSRGAVFLPQTRDELNALLSAFLLEKAIYELGYELNNRPDWVWLPLQGIGQLIASGWQRVGTV